MPDYSSQLQAACAAARAAGAFLRARFTDAGPVNEELPHDIKLQLDKDSQAIIVESLLKAFPGYAVLGEEGNAGSEEADSVWIVDPIDGTVNYFYGIPIFCVSIALRVRGELVLGCVYDPMQDECFTASAGGAAYLNGREIKVSSRKELAKAVIFVGHGSHDGSGEEGIRRFAYLSARVRKIRILGSAALTLCYIAAGRFDAYIENRIHLWDFAAAGVILASAGGQLEFTPREDSAETGSVIAWNGHLPLPQTLSQYSSESQ